MKNRKSPQPWTYMIVRQVILLHQFKPCLVPRRKQSPNFPILQWLW